MAIKKRTPDARREQAIRAFGDGADQPLTAAPEIEAQELTPVVTPPRPKTAVTAPIEHLNGGPATMLLRFDNDELPRLLAEVATLDGRKKHPMALRALALGLETIRDSYQ